MCELILFSWHPMASQGKSFFLSGLHPFRCPFCCLQLSNQTGCIISDAYIVAYKPQIRDGTAVLSPWRKLKLVLLCRIKARSQSCCLEDHC